MPTLPQFYINVPALRPGTPGGYALALVSVGVATVLRVAVDPWVVGVPFATFWPAVVLTALISGIGAGLICVAFSTAAAAFFVMAPHLSLYVEGRRDLTDLLLFVVLASFCVILITQLHDAIDRELAERALRVMKERLQLALDTAELGWWQYDPRRLLAAGDARFKEIFDVTADEVPIGEIMKRVHPDDAERFWEEHSAMLDPTGPPRSSREYRVQASGGEVRWVRVSWLAYHDGAGAERQVANVVGTAQDITEHKEVAEREHLLARESAHRTKNLISVVDAIAHQTATKDPEDFIERFSDRMQALAANQDLIVRNEWKGVEIKALVHAQLAHFAELVDGRISVDGPRVRVKADTAQAIGLALHSLPPMPRNTGRCRRTGVV